MSAPAPPQLPPIPADIGKLLTIRLKTAPLVIGELLATYLFGVLSVQFYIYHISFPRDTKFLQCILFFLLDLASTTMCIADAFHWFAEGFGNLFTLDDIHLSAIDTPMLGACLAAIAQSYYCYRLWTINRKTLPICILVVLIALAQVVSGIYGAVVGSRIGKFSKVAAELQPTVYILNIGAAVADVLIAVTMTILAPLLSLTVILLVGAPNTNYFTCPSIILGKIYSNSLLLMLNNRKFIADRVNNDFEDGRVTLNKFRAAPRTDVDSTPLRRILRQLTP
ncbi:hypothetical protein C8J57DRAFT_1680438 [Mycena rebaudengoi]|nr:hypothetical protein C8J57DRAFT_1680438 [Mycena rebaudengoi]